MTPTVNVHLAYNPRDPHSDEAQLLIPCPVPRSVTFSVPLGECMCPPSDSGRIAACRADPSGHFKDCPARPVRVSCSISGETWEGSEVAECEVREGTPIDERNALYTACRARWALIKALVLGQHGCCAQHMPDALREQRNSVYAALADMARAEARAYEAQNTVSLACGRGVSVYHPTATHQRPSTPWLAAYVEHLIEQVGIL